MSGCHELISAFKLRYAARYLHQGGVIAYPTEAVYGLGCDPFDPEAVGRLLELKGRAAEKGLILIAAHIDAVESIVDFSRVSNTQTICDSWPGPVTWVLPAKENIPGWLQGKHHSIAVRVTDHPVAAALCNAFGGSLVSTSANHSGKRPAKTALQVRAYFSACDLLIVSGQLGSLAKPTQMFDAATGKRLR